MRIGPTDSAGVFVSLRSLSFAAPRAATAGDASSSQLRKPLLLTVRDRDAPSANDSAERLGRIRDLLTGVRNAARQAANASFDGAAAGQTASFTGPTLTRVQAIASRTRLVTSTAVAGLNRAQIAGADFGGAPPNEVITVQGQVTRAADAAQLTIRGGSGAIATAGGTYELSGNRGSVNLTLHAGQSLLEAAQQINDQTASTGLAAELRGNDLVLTSQQLGSAATVQVRPLALDYATSIDGVNAAQLGSFQVNSLTPGTTETITGSLVSAAQGAGLTYHGAAGGVVAGSVSFRLSGSRGAASIALVQGESLSSAAQRINDATAATGVIASVSEDDLQLTSDTTGAAASVKVDSIERTYDQAVSGLNPAQVADFVVTSLDPGTEHSLAGEVLRSASSATLILQGSADGTVIDTASFQISGSLGSASVSITQGESLDAVANRVNGVADSTGVTAGVANNQLVFASSDVGTSAHAEVQLTHVNHTNVVSGVDDQQFADFQVQSLAEGETQTFTGSVVRAASQATLALQGSAGGTVIDSATFAISGALGSASVSIAQGESLAAVAGRINALSDDTGVVASASGTQLVIQSRDVGSAAQAQVQLTHVNHTNVVSGVNGQQLAGFQVNSFTEGESQTLSGSVTQTAGIAQLVFTGSLGFVGANATFTLTGSQGSAQISVSAFQSLSSLASAVNAQTAATGVKAVVQGQQVKFQSVGVGTAATVAIHATSGSFAVTGGNGNGTANGTNAVAIINGQTITGAGNQFTLSDAKGSYSFTAASGFTGSLSPVSIVSQAGSFAISGGNGDGTANGSDALAVVNGQTLTGAGNDFIYSDDKGSYSFTTAAGFTGAFSPVTVESQAGSFALSGGNGDGTASGLDAQAVINGQALTGDKNRFSVSEAGGQFEVEFVPGFTGSFETIMASSVAQPFDLSGGDGAGLSTGADAVAVIDGVEYTSADEHFTVPGAHGSYEIDFAPGFTGSFDPITVVSTAQQLQIDGGVAPGLAYGSDAEAIINGQQLTGDESLFRVALADRTATIQFQPGFVGAFDPITVTGQTHKVREPVVTSRLVPTDAPANSSFGAAAGEEPPDPLAPLLEQIDELDATAFADAKRSEASPDQGLTRSSVTSQAFASLAPNSPLASPAARDLTMAGVIEQLRHAINLLA